MNDKGETWATWSFILLSESFLTWKIMCQNMQKNSSNNIYGSSSVICRYMIVRICGMCYGCSGHLKLFI